MVFTEIRMNDILVCTSQPPPSEGMLGQELQLQDQFRVKEIKQGKFARLLGDGGNEILVTPKAANYFSRFGL